MTTPSTTTSASTLAAPSPGLLGRFKWHELLTHDQDAAKTFYSKVLGWGEEIFPTAAGNYVMWTVAGVPTGGYFPMPAEVASQGTPQHWLTYIGVPNVDEATAKATAAGASVHVQPRDIPDVGRFAVLADAQGAAFAIYTPINDTPAQPGMVAVGDASWHELATTDSAAAYAFYTELFAWDNAGEMDMGGGEMYRMFGRNGIPLGGIFTMKDVPPNWLPYFRVADIAKAVESITANGGAIVKETMEVPGGDQIAVASDPQGGMFAVHEVKGG